MICTIITENFYQKGYLAIALVVFAVAVNAQVAGVDSALIPKSHISIIKKNTIFDKSIDPAKWLEQKIYMFHLLQPTKHISEAEVPWY